MSEYKLSDDQNSLSVVGTNRAGADKVFKYKATQAGFGCKWCEFLSEGIYKNNCSYPDKKAMACSPAQRTDKRAIIWVHQH